MKSHKEIINLFNSNLDIIERDISSSNFQQSLNCLKSKIGQIILIRDSIYLLRENYTTQIMFRSQIEHFLVGFYVFLRLRIEKNDDVGLEYYDFYSNSEYFKQETYSLQVDDLKNKNKRKINIETLRDKLPHIGDLTQKELEDYHYEANKFKDIKKIGKFLIENCDFEPKLTGVVNHLVNLLDKYSFLSSYIHGGPFAERENSTNSKEIILKEFKNTQKWADIVTRISIGVFFLSLSYENEERYLPLFRKVYEK
jgi:hypothetical protein